MSRKYIFPGKRTILYMKPILLPASLFMCAAFTAATAFSQPVVKAAPSGAGTETIYRQVMPDGRVVYADRTLPGGRVDNTIKVERPIKGNVWTVESGATPVAPKRAEPTTVKRVAVSPGAKKMSLDEANAEVIRAEMLLEDAKQQQQTGIEPLPGERTGNAGGGSRLNEAYQARQQLLAKYVSYAEAALHKANQERNRLR